MFCNFLIDNKMRELEPGRLFASSAWNRENLRIGKKGLIEVSPKEQRNTLSKRRRIIETANLTGSTCDICLGLTSLLQVDRE